MRYSSGFVLATALMLATLVVVRGEERIQPSLRPLIDCTDEELLQRVPSLRGVQFDRSPALLNVTLDLAGKALDTSMESFVDLSAKEEIFELRSEIGGAEVDAKREEFRHVMHLPLDRAASGSPRRLLETRISEKEKKAGQAGGAGFFVVSRFTNLLEFLLPENQPLSRFRSVGRIGSGEAESIVLVYAYIPGGSLDSGLIAKAGAAPEPMQGVVWVHAKTGWPRRVLVEPLKSLTESGMDELRTEVVTAPVRFASIDATLLLPLRVTTDARRARTQTHTVHELTEFRLFGVDSAGDPEMEKQYTGVFTALPPSSDAYELLAYGLTLRLERKDAEALAPLREAARLDAGLAAARVNLGLALNATGDSTGAENELREASKQLGGVASVHYALGIVLYHRGSAAESAAEFREAIRLAPKDPIGHANLAMALQKLGDVKLAIEEMQAAVELDPKNSSLKSKLEELAGISAAATKRAAEAVPTIRVDVRQVVVPVMVLDNNGHHVSGLKQADFRVLEDGAEQTTTAFQIETSGQATFEAEPNPIVPATTGPPKAAAANPELPAIRHTFMICIDTMHAEFGNLHYVREALQKFFKSELAGDTQYAVIAIGQSMNIVQNLTRDPAKALATLDDKSFLKMFMGSKKSNWDGDIKQYLRELSEIRSELDSPDPIVREMGRMRMQSLPSQAQGLASLDRSLTVTLLEQLRALVGQMTKSREHRTVLLLSDGFQMSPGREAWELTIAYFPELSSLALRGQERLTAEFDAIVGIAAKSNIVIDTIDSRGLYTPSFFDASNGGVNASVAPRVLSAMNSLQSEAGSSLMEFAAATGGTTYSNSNDIFAGIQKAIAEGRDYYTLAYVPTNSAMDGKFRAINVEVKGRKLTVKAKRGYWATAN